jgi:hypothetical protein
VSLLRSPWTAPLPVSLSLRFLLHSLTLSVKQWRQKLDYGNLPKLKSWGLEVNPNMMRVDARVLPTPKVTYNQGKTLNCQFGGWNLKGVRVSSTCFVFLGQFC